MPDIPESQVDIVGPFNQHEVRVTGRNVPFLTASPQGEESVLLVLDDRWGLELSIAEVERVTPFIAQCIAVALGYTCHPSGDEEPRRSQPFTRTMAILDSTTENGEDGA